MLRHRLLTVLVVAFSVVGAAACGGGGDDDDASSDTTAAAAESTTTTTAAAVGAATTTLDETVWFGGFELTFESAELVADPSPRVDIVTTFANEGDDNATLNATLNLQSAGNSYQTGFENDIPEVPGKSQGKGVISFDVDDDFTFDDAVLTIGNPQNNQAVVPFGSEGELVTLEPRDLDVTGTATADNLVVEVSGGMLRADIPENHDQVEAGHLALWLDFDVSNTGEFAGGYAFSHDNLALELPDGTTVGVDDGPIELLQAERTLPDQTVRFIVDDPPEGTYQLVVIDDTEDPHVRGTMAFEIAAA